MVILEKLQKWWKSWKRKRKRAKAKKKPLEFSKLPIFYRESVSDVTTTVFTACIGYLITYAGKSLGEKVSRNKHRLDADGNPLPDEESGKG